LSFINEDFLLQCETARRLYHEFAEGEPILDFHSHLPAAEIAEDRRFRDLTEIWLEGDHYKWRCARNRGRYCRGTIVEISGMGSSSFCAAQSDHWTHLELALLRN
jgi:glucuronate isomerase